MKAMVFAAGLGTRLRPLTDDRPKALVTIAGRTLLDIVLARLRAFGVREVIVNVHHFADQVVAYLAANQYFGMRIEVSREEVLLDTGGGLKKAAWFFFESGADEPFLIHNVDVLSTIDLARMAWFHSERRALATVAVESRSTSRPLQFDAEGRLVRRAPKAEDLSSGGSAQLETLAFGGIHVVSPRIFAKLEEEGAFSIIDAYVRLAAQGDSILGFRADGAYWRDLGRPDDLIAAERDMESGRYPAK
ncbi:MAG: nucleotidyltransferase family protein [Terracidiphilus sp.]|nr:nucleotidyltransferase family protein [Terracidiphilus sp.]MDR3797635.1 nucleotidyltransferase family protein [Terracidiphilus sp.]